MMRRLRVMAQTIPDRARPTNVSADSRTDENQRSRGSGEGRRHDPEARRHLEWGGYGGSFADPDGYIWNIRYSAQGEDQPDAE